MDRLGGRSSDNRGVATDDAGNPIEIPITGELDLHTFRPAEVTRLLDDYFSECRKRGIRRVRVVHGKGTGKLREMVHAHLRSSAGVIRFALDEGNAGGWGATWVTLKD